MTQRKLLSLLLLTQLLVPSQAQAFFGLGKFPSMMEAKAACDEWVKDGAIETYEKETPLSEREKFQKLRPFTEAYAKQMSEIRAQSKANPKRTRISEGSAITYDPYELQKDAATSLFTIEADKIKNLTKSITIERPSRSCKREDETKQFIGIDKSKATKHFRY